MGYEEPFVAFRIEDKRANAQFTNCRFIGGLAVVGQEHTWVFENKTIVNTDTYLALEADIKRLSKELEERGTKWEQALKFFAADQHTDRQKA